MRNHALAIVAVWLGLGCSLDAGDGRAGSRPAPPPAECTMMEQQLRACGLITAGAVPCDIRGDHRDQCLFGCLEGATCAELEDMICNGVNDDGLPQGRIAECIVGCADQPFRCDSGQDTFASAECDGFVDCNDGSDEVGCEQATFVCVSGEVFSADFRCDGFVDCADGASDEQNCPAEAQRICGGVVVPN